MKIYDALNQRAGWRHAETLSWINNAGDFLFGAKADILTKLEVGGQAMVEYGPDSLATGFARATRFERGQTARLGNANYHVRIVGGYHDATAAIPVK